MTNILFSKNMQTSGIFQILSVFYVHKKTGRVHLAFFLLFSTATGFAIYAMHLINRRFFFKEKFDMQPGGKGRNSENILGDLKFR